MTAFSVALALSLVLYGASAALALYHFLRLAPEPGKHALPRAPLAPRIGAVMLIAGSLIVIVATLATRAGVA